MNKNRGITLIALVITIIVLLILAGVSIAMLTGNNGILNQAGIAKENTERAKDEETLKLAITTNKIEENKIEIGKTLYDKNIQNGNKWRNIVIKDTNQVYGTGWNYVPKNTKIENYDTMQYNWLVNESTGEMIRLEDDSYTEISYETTVGSTEGLIFNLDSSIIGNHTQEEIQNNYKEILGRNVELKNINWNAESGLTKGSFNLDGVDDYIKVEYNNEEEKKQLAENGFTFEFYGVLNDGTSYDNTGALIDNAYKGIFCYWNGNENLQAELRFGTLNQGKIIRWNAGGLNRVSDYSESESSWNIRYPAIESFEYGKEGYFTITVDCKNSYEKEGTNYYTHTIYFNGQKLYEGGYNKENWDHFITKNLNTLRYFCIGRSSMSSDGYWHYSKMNAYAIRLYNRALTGEEVGNNYTKSVAYHEIIGNNNPRVKPVDFHIGL